MKLPRLPLLAFAFLFLQPAAQPQSAAPAAASAATAVPPLVPYSGVALGGDGKPLSGEIGVTFLIYKEESGGEPLWAESQTVAIDSAGHYKVQLGATSPNGLPADLFATGEARWLETQIAGHSAQSRVLLASVPYALKAGDAATLGGLPASAYALAGSKAGTASGASAGVSPNSGSNVTTPGGVTGYVPLFTGAATIADSQVFDNGTDVGIGTATPTAKLDVVGTAIVTGGLSAEGGASFGGSVNILGTGNATAAGGKDSLPLSLVASSYDSATKAAVAQVFRLQAEPAANDTASPSATLNLLFGTTPAETGLAIGSNGVVKFAAGQTFPGTGAGTITGVTAGTALTGGGTSGNVTLNVDTTKVPLLNSANSFTGSQSVVGNLSVTGGETILGPGSFGAGGATTGLSATGVGTAMYDAGVHGIESAATAQVAGVLGETGSTGNGAAGVIGFENSTTAPQVFGVLGHTKSTGTQAAGVVGDEGAATGQVYGVAGQTSSTGAGAAGVAGQENATTGQVYGVEGISKSPMGAGGLFQNTSAGAGAKILVAEDGSGTQRFSVDTQGHVVIVTGTTTPVTAPLTPVNHARATATVDFGTLVTLDWAFPFPDTNYTATCSYVSTLPVTNNIYGFQINSLSASSLQVSVAANTATSITIHCIGVHD